MLTGAPLILKLNRGVATSEFWTRTLVKYRSSRTVRCSPCRYVRLMFTISKCKIVAIIFLKLSVCFFFFFTPLSPCNSVISYHIQITILRQFAWTVKLNIHNLQSLIMVCWHLYTHNIECWTSLSSFRSPHFVWLFHVIFHEFGSTLRH